MTDKHPLKQAIDSFKKKAEESAAQSASMLAKENKLATEINDAWLRAKAMILKEIAEANELFRSEGLHHIFKFEEVPQPGDGNLQKAKLWLICPPQFVAPLVDCDVTVRAKDGQVTVKHSINLAGRPTHGHETFAAQDLTEEQWTGYLAKLYGMIA